MTTATMPKAGQKYRDNIGRELEVTTVDPANREDRHVQGIVTYPNGKHYLYATNFLIFKGVWKERLAN